LDYRRWLVALSPRGLFTHNVWAPTEKQECTAALPPINNDVTAAK
jgi:hypothetical protein